MSDIFDAKCPLKSPASKEGKLLLAKIFIDRCDRMLDLLKRRYELDKKTGNQYDWFHNIHTELFTNMKLFYASEYAEFQKLPEDEDGMVNATVMFNPTNAMCGFDMIRNHIDWILDSMERFIDDPLVPCTFYLQAGDAKTSILHLDKIYQELIKRN